MSSVVTGVGRGPLSRWRATASRRACSIRSFRRMPLSRCGIYRINDVLQDAVERPGHPVEIQRPHEHSGGLDLSAPLRPEEAAQLLLVASSAPLRLVLEGAERFELTLRIDDALHDGGPKGTNQLVLQVGDADIETEPLHVAARQVGTEAGALETALKVALFTGVAQTGQPEAQPMRTESFQEASNVRRAAHGHDGNASSLEMVTAAGGERVERKPVANPLNEDDGLGIGRRLHGRHCTAEVQRRGTSANAGSGVSQR